MTMFDLIYYNPENGTEMTGGMPGMGGMQSMAGAMPGMGMPGAGGFNHGMMGQQGMMGIPQQQQQVPIAGVQPSVMPVSAPHSVPVPVAAPVTIEWAIPQQKRVAFSAQFQVNDKARTGFLAAVQARSVLLQTGLAQQTLATVWNLADIDKDGKLNVEEFILAMHLCDMGQKGEPLPDPLPIQLVPPSLRRTWQSQQPGSGATTPGSVSSVPGVTGLPAAQMPMGMPQAMPALPAGIPGMHGVPVIPGMPPGMTP